MERKVTVTIDFTEVLTNSGTSELMELGEAVLKQLEARSSVYVTGDELRMDKVTAIKAVRDRHGCSLRVAKDAVESADEVRKTSDSEKYYATYK